MREAKLSSYAGLAKYITSSQSKQERVGEVRLTNFQSESLDWAITEALHVQQLNQRAEGDKTYHLLISFAPGEQPSAEILRDVEDRICASIGFGEHQRISAVHTDTDNLHIHIAINKIHPERHTIHEPFRAYKTMGDMASILEREHGLHLTNHAAKKTGSENRADDMEQHAGIESLLGWIKKECAADLAQARSWTELHDVMRSNGLEIQARGNGFVITDGLGVGVKASSVSREFSKSKLEKRLGTFELDAKTGRGSKRGPGMSNRKPPPVIPVGGRPPPVRRNRLAALSQLRTLEGEPAKRYQGRPVRGVGNPETTELYARYKASQGIGSHARAKDWATAKVRKDNAIESAKRSGRAKRAAIKILDAPGITKKLLYSQVSKAMHAEIQRINAAYMSERQVIHAHYPKRTWADWLQAQAKDGDQAALKALRGRKAVRPKVGDSVVGTGPVRRHGAVPLKVDSVTKDGTVIHRFGSSAIRDDGEALQVSRGSGQVGIEAVLRMAVHRYGESLAVNGSENFKEQVVQVAASSNLKIIFKDANLEARRLELVAQQTKETGNDRPRQSNRRSTERGRTTARGNDGDARSERAGATARAGVRRGPGRTNKSGSGGVGGPRPPSLSGNSLRELPELGVVRIPDRREVLLPSDVPNHMQHQGAKHAGGMRRSVPEPGRGISQGARAPGRTNRPGVVPVGGKPPAMLRGKLQHMSKLRSLPITEPAVTAKSVQIPNEPAQARSRSAADKYIDERMSKRAKGFDIPNHRGYTDADKGPSLFAGSRQVEGETLALLRRDDEIVVLSVDPATARRIKRYSLGDEVTVNAKGALTKKGRSR
ncbi:relaxase/mobilization nuclease domain-containing protein [Pseudomonas syringae pv. syringae]|nr:TraI/MobA(P) family conjugative relaxase [Pseudomonas syringae]MCK9709861.1 relaxase/mobilization nuclease domain-containing protein [Pseudomonas syringae pv. syringae]